MLRQFKVCHAKTSHPDKFDQFLEDNFLTGRAISMTLCMKITVTIVLVLRYYVGDFPKNEDFSFSENNLNIK
jgi:hypothetical protein